MCYDKWSYMLSKFKKELEKVNASGGGATQWEYFNEMERLNAKNRVIHPVTPLLVTTPTL